MGEGEGEGKCNIAYSPCARQRPPTGRSEGYPLPRHSVRKHHLVLANLSGGLLIKNNKHKEEDESLTDDDQVATSLNFGDNTIGFGAN